jgi:hypothetical protein
MQRSAAALRYRGRRGGSGNLAIAAAEKLDQAQAVAERVSDGDDFAPSRSLDLCLSACPCSDGADESGLHILHYHVEMHGRPVAIVSTQALCRAHRAFWLLQETQTHGPSVELRTVDSKSPHDGEAEGGRVEGNGRGHIGDIDIDE